MLVNKKKWPLETIQTVSEQNKRFAFLGKESEKAISSLIKKYRITTKTDQSIIHIRKIKLEFNRKTIFLTYKPSNKESEITKIDAISRACNESLLACDGYRWLAAVKTSLIHEYLIANRRIEITNLINKDIKIGTFNIGKSDDLSNNLEEYDDSIIVNEEEIGNGIYKSIYTILRTLILIWKQSFFAIIKPDDILKLKLNSNGHNVYRKQNHVMVTFCLLNEDEEVLKPEYQYW